MTWSNASEGVSHSSSLSPRFWGGRPQAASLVRGDSPRNAPFKTRPASRPTDPRLLYPIHCPQPFPLCLFMTPADRAGAFLAQVSSSTITVCGDHKTVFVAALRGQKEVAVAVLQLPFSAALSWPFVDKKKLTLPFCNCRSPRPFVDQKGVPHDPPRTDHN